jgi:hypothetical protein
MKTKAFPEANLPPQVQEKADRMNLDEACVPPYSILPLPFNAETAAAEKYTAVNRTLEQFSKEMYGDIPPRCEKIEFVETSSGTAFNGLADRKEIDIICSGNGITRTLHLLLYLPAGRTGKVPCFLGMNFTGNVDTTDDPEVTFHSFKRYSDPSPWLNDNRSDGTRRGLKAGRWEFEKVLQAGFGSATLCLFDAFPDHPDGFDESIMPMFYSKEEWNSPRRKSGAISAWAWGLMRAVDALENRPEIDCRKIIVHGLSRLGKTALWTGANDPRIAMTVSICSGTCGAKLSRRYFGESIEWLDNWRKYWFVPGFENFVRRDTEMPVDQNQLMALIAPRFLYVASATDDGYADPTGEYLATMLASEAWGKDGIPSDSPFPAPDSGIGNDAVRYFLRRGEHNFTLKNWEDLLAFARKHFLSE